MATTQDRNRVSAKAAAVLARLEDIYEQREILINLLDEHKLDLMILALGLGQVALADNT